MRVFVSGYGIISALGTNAKENFSALQSKASGISPPKFLQTKHSGLVVGEVNASNKDLIAAANLKEQGLQSRTALLGLIAAKEAIKSAGLSKEHLYHAAFINGTSVGGMDITEVAYTKLSHNEPIDFQAAFNGHDCGHSTQVIARELSIKGYKGTISTACSSSANTIMHGARLIKSGQTQCAIVGGTDALSMFTLNGFNSLKILDSEWCKPFDKDRKGLNLGEGSAFLILESEQHLEKRGGTALAELAGYGNANDAYHQTASSPEGKGALAAMQDAFEVAKMVPDQVDYINAHGTGTLNNDESESLAIKKLFREKMPAYSSTKAFTGHTLGAAGAIEAVFSVMAIENQALFPCLNVINPMDVIGIPVMENRANAVSAVLSNSFGFGGNCSSLIFRNHKEHYTQS